MAYNTELMLGKLLNNSKLKADCGGREAGVRLRDTMCGKVYVGVTQRDLSMGRKEHQQSVKNKEFQKSTLAQYLY